MPKMGELVIKKGLERDTRGVDLQSLFLTFLGCEFDKINVNCFNPKNPGQNSFPVLTREFKENLPSH